MTYILFYSDGFVLDYLVSLCSVFDVLDNTFNFVGYYILGSVLIGLPFVFLSGGARQSITRGFYTGLGIAGGKAVGDRIIQGAGNNGGAGGNNGNTGTGGNNGNNGNNGNTGGNNGNAGSTGNTGTTGNTGGQG